MTPHAIVQIWRHFLHPPSSETPNSNRRNLCHVIDLPESVVAPCQGSEPHPIRDRLHLYLRLFCTSVNVRTSRISGPTSRRGSGEASGCPRIDGELVG
jgi:hypothetical protein